MKLLALINARKGSKGIKNKNKKLLNGKPLISWTFDVVKKMSYRFEETILSTNDLDIIKIAKEYDIKVPFIRPESLSKDSTLQIDVIKHALIYAEKKKKFDAVILFQPTNPIRSIKDVENCIKLFKKENPDNVITVVKTKKNLLNTIYEKKKKFLIPKFNHSNRGTLRQNNVNYFSRVGSIYIIKTKLIRKGILFGKKILGVEVNLLNSFDIDEPDDWKLISIINKSEK